MSAGWIKTHSAHTHTQAQTGIIRVTGEHTADTEEDTLSMSSETEPLGTDVAWRGFDLMVLLRGSQA